MEGHFFSSFFFIEFFSTSFFNHFNLPYYAKFVKSQPSYLPTTLSALSFALCPAMSMHTMTALHPISGTIESEGLKEALGRSSTTFWRSCLHRASSEACQGMWLSCPDGVAVHCTWLSTSALPVEV